MRRIRDRLGAADLSKHSTIGEFHAGGGAWVMAIGALQARMRRDAIAARDRIAQLDRIRRGRPDRKATDDEKAERRACGRLVQQGWPKGMAMDLDPLAPGLGEARRLAERYPGDWTVIACAPSVDPVWCGFLTTVVPRVQVVVGNPPYSVTEPLYTPDGQRLLYPPGHRKAGQPRSRKHVVAELHARRALEISTRHVFLLLPLPFLCGQERHRDGAAPHDADQAFWNEWGHTLRGLWPLITRPSFGEYAGDNTSTSGRKGTSSQDYAIFWWDKSRRTAYGGWNQEIVPLDWEHEGRIDATQT